MGRPLGAKNKAGMLISWAGTERDPALYLARVMCDERQDANRRVQAGVALMPYVHRKLPMAIEADVSAQGSFTVEIRRVGDGTPPPSR